MKKSVQCGNIIIGGGAPVSIQSMLNVDTRDVDAAVYQIDRLCEVGCDIVRLAIPDMEAAEAFGRIKKARKSVPLVADIHFDYHLALAAIKNGADKIRINPGNIGPQANVMSIVSAAKKRGIPIRIGVNSGSLENDIFQKEGRVTAEGLASSALRSIRMLENMGFDDIVISLKSSDVKMNDEAHRMVRKATDHPMHIGITEAGIAERGKIKSAVGIGALLLSGIGDTVRVSLTGDPVDEVIFAKELLEVIGIRDTGIDIISCPTCGRTKVDLQQIVNQISPLLEPIKKARNKAGLGRLTVAVMGCAVNGPGEARSADLGVACGDGTGLIFSKGKTIKMVPEQEIAAEIVRMAETYEAID